MNSSLNTLHGYATGSCIRAAIALHEAGIDFEVAHVDLPKRQHHEAQFTALNPHQKVPVLVKSGPDGFVLTQSNAIMMYASEQGKRTLLPRAGLQRHRALERYFFFITDVIAIGNAAFNLGKIGDETMASAIDWLRTRSREAAIHAERFLAEGPFIAGDELTLADISAFTYIGSIKAQLDWAALPHLQKWHSRLSELDGFKRGMGAFKLS